MTHSEYQRSSASQPDLRSPLQTSWLQVTATTNTLDHEADIAKGQDWLGHANVFTSRLFDRKRMRQEQVATFNVTC